MARYLSHFAMPLHATIDQTSMLLNHREIPRAW